MKIINGVCLLLAFLVLIPILQAGVKIGSDVSEKIIQLNKKLDGIIIQKMDFNQVSLDEVIKTLERESCSSDVSKKGVKIVIAPSNIYPDKFTPPLSKRKLSFSVKKATVRDVLRIIQFDLGINYFVKENEVVLSYYDYPTTKE